LPLSSAEVTGNPDDEKAERKRKPRALTREPWAWSSITFVTVPLFQSAENRLSFKLVVPCGGADRRGCILTSFSAALPLLLETPWGRLTYLEYRQRLELGHQAYDQIDAYCRQLKIDWFASVWDEPSVDFLVHYNPPYLKIPSAQLTNHALLRKVCRTGVPLILSTGMSTEFEIGSAMQVLKDEKARERVTLLHTVSAYPCQHDVNLKVMRWLATLYHVPVGYSGHEKGLQITLAAVALGAVMIERHITLDRTMWGTDHAASLEPRGLETLVRDIRIKARPGCRFRKPRFRRPRNNQPDASSASATPTKESCANPKAWVSSTSS
jgi:sialic acid synthase SpsE